MRVLLPLVVLVLVVLFVLGFVAPRRSVRVQRWMDKRLNRGERRADRRWGTPGDWLAKLLEMIQQAGDASTRAGRKLRKRA